MCLREYQYCLVQKLKRYNLDRPDNSFDEWSKTSIIVLPATEHFACKLSFLQMLSLLFLKFHPQKTLSLYQLEFGQKKYEENKEILFSKLDIISLTVDGDNIEFKFSDIILDETGVPVFK